MKTKLKKIKKVIMENWMWLIFLMALVGFIAIAEDVFEQEIMKLDTIAYKILVENLRNGVLTPIMHTITTLGSGPIILGITILSLALVRDKKIGTAILSNLVLITLFNIILKNIVQRPRPEGYRLVAESGYSFPSGHSMVNTAFYGFIIYLIFTKVKNKNIKYTLCILLALLIPLIAISRVYLGVHYASDVTAGFLLSIAYLVCFITAFNSVNKEKLLDNLDKKSNNKSKKETITSNK